MGHLVGGIALTVVVATCKLADVPIQVLFAEVVVGAVVTALEKRPEALYPVRVSHPIDVLANRVLDRLMGSGEALIARMVIGVDRGALSSPVYHEALQRLFVGSLDHRRAYLVGLAILYASDGHLANRATASMQLFRFMLIAFLAADVGFVPFDRTKKSSIGAFQGFA